MANIYNYHDNTLLSGTSNNDVVFNGGNWYTSSIKKYNYLVSVAGGSEVSIDGGAGNDSIYSGGRGISVNAGEGDDYIKNQGDYSKIYGFHL